jgi:hypothetical protein
MPWELAEWTGRIWLIGGFDERWDNAEFQAIMPLRERLVR